jgi:uncharacterized protein (TIGR02646 family)
MIAIQRSAEPEILKSKGKTERDTLCQQFDNGQKNFEFKSAIYADNSVKEALKTMQHHKCCFCESNFSHISYGDVEHFRPKGGYKQNETDKDLVKPGYYWLAYDWNNLLVSCTLCNQKYKANLFPLLDDSKRAKNHHVTLANETPLLINPTLQNPEDYISFREEKPFAINNNLYGKNTITLLALDREELNTQRLKEYEIIQTLIDIIEDIKKYPDDLILQGRVQKAQMLIHKRMQPQAEYSAMIKAAINQTHSL